MGRCSRPSSTPPEAARGQLLGDGWLAAVLDALLLPQLSEGPVREPAGDQPSAGRRSLISSPGNRRLAG